MTQATIDWDELLRLYEDGTAVSRMAYARARAMRQTRGRQSGEKQRGDA